MRQGTTHIRCPRRAATSSPGAFLFRYLFRKGKPWYTSELDEDKRAEYLKEYTDYQNYRIKAKEIAKEVLAKLK